MKRECKNICTSTAVSDTGFLSRTDSDQFCFFYYAEISELQSKLNQKAEKGAVCVFHRIRENTSDIFQKRQMLLAIIPINVQMTC